MKTPVCSHCGSYDEVKLRTNINSNGNYLIGWYCTSCNHWAENPIKWLKYPEVSVYLENWGKSIIDIPILEDRSKENPCMICGEPGERHHLAPQAYKEEFGEEWDTWPILNLCKYHHTKWHKIITPSLVTHDTRDQE